MPHFTSPIASPFARAAGAAALLAALLAGTVAPAQAQTSTPAAAAPRAATASAPAGDWKYKTRWLNRAEVDKLLAQPRKVLLIDVRRPDELISKGSFPVFLSIQFKDVAKYAAYIPRDRQLILVSNRAHRAGEVGDQLTQQGFKVAGAAGSLDYEEQGGAIARIQPPPPRTPASAPAAQ